MTTSTQAAREFNALLSKRSLLQCHECHSYSYQWMNQAIWITYHHDDPLSRHSILSSLLPSNFLRKHNNPASAGFFSPINLSPFILFRAFKGNQDKESIYIVGCKSLFTLHHTFPLFWVFCLRLGFSFLVQLFTSLPNHHHHHQTPTSPFG